LLTRLPEAEIDMLQRLWENTALDSPDILIMNSPVDKYDRFFGVAINSFRKDSSTDTRMSRYICQSTLLEERKQTSSNSSIFGFPLLRIQIAMTTINNQLYVEYS
jgi:hypothetical protein